MGCNEKIDKQCGDNEKPYHMVYLDAFYVDKFEVTQAEYNECVKSSKCRANKKFDGFTGDRQPVVGVSWEDAKTYCAWAGKRLPTEAEWEKAARGTDGRIYPWGNTIETNKANYDETVVKTREVGRFPAGASPYGVLDMVGNTWQWVSDWYQENYYSQRPGKNPHGPDSGSYRVLRGGCWYNFTGTMRVSERFSTAPSDQLNHRGFRCARDILNNDVKLADLRKQNKTTNFDKEPPSFGAPEHINNDVKLADLRKQNKMTNFDKEPPSFGAPEHIGSNVNSKYTDTHPVISADGQTLYFTSDRPGGFGKQDGWFSKKIAGEWTKAVNMGPSFNTADNEGPDCFTADEQTMYFTCCDRPGGMGMCDICVTTREGDHWTKPKNLGSPINTKYNESNASIAPDGRTLYFISTRPGGRGPHDIWYSNKDGQGNWMKPKNIGPVIGTRKNEINVFMYWDGRTLFFASDGHGGFGQADLFMSNLADNGWTEPINLGPNINTAGDDVYLTIPASGNVAYFSAGRADSLGPENIYMAKIER
jgi:hypothetical protein